MPTPSASDEIRLERALHAVETGLQPNLAASARHYNCNYDLLRARQRGRGTNHTRGGHNTALDEEQEESLELYCKRLILMGEPPERRHIEKAANTILRAKDKHPVSKAWITRWTRRHKDLLRPRRTLPLAVERKQAHQIEDIQAHFHRFQDAQRQYSVKPENTWNMDETGWRVGCLGRRVVFTFPEVTAVYIADPDTRETVTGIEAINAIGDATSALLIMPGFELLEKYSFNDIDDNVSFCTNRETGSGYTNDQIAIDWLEKFEEDTRPGVKIRNGVVHNGEWRLLIFDGHSSHCTIEFVSFCWDHLILPFRLPAHSTHLLQPLDVGFYSSEKGHYQSILSEQARYGGASNYSKCDFLEAYNEVSVRTKSKHTIVHAWEKAGLFPFDPNRVIKRMQEMEGPRVHQKAHTPYSCTTPELESEPKSPSNKWENAQTPALKLSAIEPYTHYINSRLADAISGTLDLTPTVGRVIEKRDKAQNILALNGTLAEEELQKRRLEEQKKARYKAEGAQRRVPQTIGLVKKGDISLRIAGREEYVAQQKEIQSQEWDKKYTQRNLYRLGVTARAAVRWQRRWQDENEAKKRQYTLVLEELCDATESKRIREDDRAEEALAFGW